MKILVTATLQFEVHVEDNCTRNQAIHFGREAIEDCMWRWPNDYLCVTVNPVEVENLDHESGEFPK